MAESLVIGREFPSKKALQQACNQVAIHHHFELVPVRSNKQYYTIKCKADNCPWRLYAARVEKSDLWQIRTFQSDHTCHGLNKTKNKQANADYIADHILEKTHENLEYRPIDIVSDIKRELGIEITYLAALRAKEIAMRVINGTHEAGYRDLPDYCAKIVNANPGSVAIVSSTHESRFERLFLCFGASASGLASCRPLLGLDGSHLKNQYKGTELLCPEINE